MLGSVYVHTSEWMHDHGVLAKAAGPERVADPSSAILDSKLTMIRQILIQSCTTSIGTCFDRRVQ